LGFLSGLVPAFRGLLSFPLALVRAIPVVAIVLLSVFWFGASILPVFVASLMGIPVMVDNVAGGIRAIPPRLLAACRVYGFSQGRLIRQVYIPGIRGPFLAALRTVFGLAWKVTVTGETLVLPRFGAGSLLYTAKVHMETGEVFAIALLMVLVCCVMERVLSFFSLDGTVHPLKGSASSCLSLNPLRTSVAPSPSAIIIDKLSIARGGKQLYKDFSITFEAGKVTAILAGSGKGKTTLLDIIAGLLSPDAGSATGGDATAYLFQEPLLLPWRSVLQNVALPLLASEDPATAENTALFYLNRVGLGDKTQRLPTQLSGGEMQRAALARAAAYPAPVLLMDEAFQSQDLPLKMTLMALTRELLANRTTLLVTHDVREALCLADRIVVLVGQPLHVALDASVPPSNSTYTHLSPALLTIEEDVIDALGS
jgi:ABC-type nitrate/sulfonate/bicarbonate transport system ATPase subunit/ABC-type proline/glycine betaine transport system permease subunit